MTQWRQLEEDAGGQLVDISYYCSRSCASDSGQNVLGVGENGDSLGDFIRGGVETDGTVFCASCGMPLWYGLEDAEFVEAQVREVLDGVAFGDEQIDEVELHLQMVDGHLTIFSGDASYLLSHRGHFGHAFIATDLRGADLDRAVVATAHELLEAALDDMGQTIAIKGD